MGNFNVLDEVPKEGDFGINTLNKKNIPRLCKRNKYGYLGFDLDGWFSWTPLRDYHKKVEFIN